MNIDENYKKKDVKIKRIYWKNKQKTKKAQTLRKPLEDSLENQIFDAFRSSFFSEQKFAKTLDAETPYFEAPHAYARRRV